jgi:hypothetical protein
MIDFSTLKGLTIPEGNVKQIADAQGNVLWSAVKPMCTVTINSSVLGPQPQIFNKAYVIIDGQTYKANTLTQNGQSPANVASLVVPSGTVIHCYSEGGGTIPGTISVNGGNVGINNGLITEYDYAVNGNVEVLLGSQSPNGMMFMTGIVITEQ